MWYVSNVTVGALMGMLKNADLLTEGYLRAILTVHVFDECPGKRLGVGRTVSK